MQVTIKLHDNQSLTVEEIVRSAQEKYGRNVTVEILPESLQPHDLIYFGIQQIITHEQLGLLFNSGPNYQIDLKKLRAEALYKIGELLDQVIIDNEDKVAS